MARVLAARLDPAAVARLGVCGAVAPGLAGITPPSSMPDIERGARRLLEAIDKRERIGLVCDHDMDGTASASVLIEGLVKLLGHPRDHIDTWVSHRLREGYGLCEGVKARILAADKRPTLLITADCGSSDAVRIEALRREGIETIVTDHHKIDSDHLGTIAAAFINPKRPDAPSGVDTTPAGCMVAWMLVAHALKLRGVENGERRKALAALLDFVAVGTIADCVDLSSPGNRAVVRYGLELITNGVRPCWQVARGWFYNIEDGATSESIAFALAPRIASTGRLDTSYPGIRFLLSASKAEAAKWGETLDEENKARREIQKELTEIAMVEAGIIAEAGKPVICVPIADGHAGVQGLIANTLMDQFHRPAIVCSPRVGTADLWSGSGRGGDYVDVEALLKATARDLGPELMPACGGHKAAGGFSLLAKPGSDSFSLLREALYRHFPACAMAKTLGDARIEHDGDLALDAQAISQLCREQLESEPYGQGFARPSFRIRGTCTHTRSIGDGTHWSLDFGSGPSLIKAIWFGAGKHLGEALKADAKVDNIAGVRLDHWQGRTFPQLILRGEATPR